MAVASIKAYYDTTTITAVKIFIVQTPDHLRRWKRFYRIDARKKILKNELKNKFIFLNTLE
jgi:hypothetical protein